MSDKAVRRGKLREDRMTVRNVRDHTIRLTYETFDDDPNGDRALVPWEVWERVVEMIKDLECWCGCMTSFREPMCSRCRALAEIGEVDGE